MAGLAAAPVPAACISRRHGLLVLAQKNCLTVVDASTGELHGCCVGCQATEVTSITLDPSGRTMLIGSSDGVVAVWQLHVSSHTGEGALPAITS